jgi:hypothetical protein
MHRPREGQSIVMVALMMTVFFGMTSLVVDLGYIMVQRRQQQNAADAVVLGVARMLAGSVGVDSGGNLAFVEQTDTTVMNKAQTLASGNWVGSGPTRTMSLQYLNCEGAVIRSAVAGATTAVPGTTCRVRATGTSSMSSFFIRAVDPTKTVSTAAARATARIAPTPLPPSVSGVWPITRWKLHPNASTNCTIYTPGAACVFWSNNGGSEDTSLGSFKEKLYPSKYSQCEYIGPPTLQLLTAWDPSRPGSECGSAAVKQSDMEYWFTNGYEGSIAVGDKIEITDPGSQGHNFSNEMRTYVNAKPEGTHPTWGNYRTVHVVLWEVGERWKNPNGPFKCWPASSGPSCIGGSNPDRITVSEIRCFIFYIFYIDESEVRGLSASCYQNTPPGFGPPSSVANTVQMVD